MGSWPLPVGPLPLRHLRFEERVVDLLVHIRVITEVRDGSVADIGRNMEEL